MLPYTVDLTPLLGISHTQTTIVNNLLREFGLTPSSRTRVAIVESAKRPNPFAMLDRLYGILGEDDTQLNDSPRNPSYVLLSVQWHLEPQNML